MRTTAPTPTALDFNALYGKSKVHVRRAIIAKQNQLTDEFQLWAALSLELLAKASLAKIHPSLVVEPDNPNSLLEANGIATNTAVRTITATEAYVRLKHTAHNFKVPIFEECKKLSSRRNAELHSGEAVLGAVPLDQWEAPFWNAAELILASFDLELSDWLDTYAQEAKALLETARSAEARSAENKIEVAKREFLAPGGQKRSKSDISILREKSLQIDSSQYDQHFRYIPDDTWVRQCPACGSQGITSGHHLDTVVLDDQSGADPGIEFIEHIYTPTEYYCPTCNLHVIGEMALNVAGMLDEYVVDDYREIEYEPDYGND